MAFKQNSPIPILEGGSNTRVFPHIFGVAFYDGTSLNNVDPGTSGYVLTSTGSLSGPSFQSVSSIGAVISVHTQSGNITPTSGVIVLNGDGTNITTSGATNTATITLASSPSVAGTVTAGTGFVATTGTTTYSSFTEGALITSSSGVTSTITGTAGYILTANAPGTAPSFQPVDAHGAVVELSADTGSATPTVGVIDIAGGTNINTSGSGNTITVNLDNTVSVSGSITAGTGLTATTGGLTVTAGTVTITPFTTTGALVSNASGVITDATASTSGYVLTSNGSGSVPSFQTPAASTNIAGGAANDLVYQTAPSTTGFVTASVSNVLTSTSSGVPTWENYLPSYNVPIDNFTITSLFQVSSIGAAVATGVSPEAMVTYTISGTQYISVVNSTDATFSTYKWNGTAFASIGAAVATGVNPDDMCAYTISGNQYISIANNTDNTFSTYKWNGTAFASIGAAVATGLAPNGICSYSISGTQYISVANYAATTFSTYSWNGTTFVSIGAAVATGTYPTAIVAYTISGTQYISITNAGDTTFSTYSWNGSAFASIGAAVATGSYPLSITAYTISGTQYIATANLVGNTITVYSWNGSAFVSIGAAISTGAGTEPNGITNYVINGTTYISTSNFGTNSVSTLAWNGTTFTLVGNMPSTGITAFGIVSYTIGGSQYLSVINDSSNTFNTYVVGSVLVSDRWTDQVSSSVTMVSNNNYVVDNGASLVTLTLPTVAAFGSKFIIQGKSSGLWKIAQNSGQTIHFGAVNTTTGTGGSISSQQQYDSISLVCITANTDFAAYSSVGNLIYV